jgi:hypothetical protein
VIFTQVRQEGPGHRAGRADLLVAALERGGDLHPVVRKRLLSLILPRQVHTVRLTSESAAHCPDRVPATITTVTTNEHPQGLLCASCAYACAGRGLSAAGAWAVVCALVVTGVLLPVAGSRRLPGLRRML